MLERAPGISCIGLLTIDITLRALSIRDKPVSTVMGDVAERFSERA